MHAESEVGSGTESAMSDVEDDKPQKKSKKTQAQKKIFIPSDKSWTRTYSRPVSRTRT